MYIIVDLIHGAHGNTFYLSETIGWGITKSYAYIMEKAWKFPTQKAAELAFNTLEQKYQKGSIVIHTDDLALYMAERKLRE
jgi:hypothetical protein